MQKRIVLLTVVGLLVWQASLADCGGDERWAVKMAADPGANQINASAVLTTLSDLSQMARPSVPSDETTRTPAEQEVVMIDARLVKFKQETGKTGDSDFHLVISDDTLLYSAGGMATAPSPHSVIAESVDPECVGGRNGTVTGSSRFQTSLVEVRTAFAQQFPNIHSGWNEADGIPVRLTGVVFFDRPHGQVGRALNGLEIHPLLKIEFNPGPLAAAVTSPPANLVAFLNPGFENGAQEGWTASDDVITSLKNEPAHTGTWKAWLGGYGTAHTDKLSHDVTLPSGAGTIALTFYLHIDTEEPNEAAYDKLFVRIRDQSGHLLKSIKTFSNLQAASGYTLQSFDLTAYKGKAIRIEMEGKEDSGSLTSFVVDDFAILIK